MPRFVLQIQQLGQPTRRVDLVDPVVVGRESTADVQVMGDDLISRRHLRLRVVNEHVDLEVLGTTNATTLNDEEVGPGRRIVVPHGARIRIGRTVLVIEAVHLDTTHKQARPRLPKERPSTVHVPNSDIETAARNSNAWLLLKGTSNRRRRSNQLLAAEAIVGSAPDSGVILVHETVAERHASLRFDGVRWYVADLGGKEGTRVDGQRVGLAPVPLRRNCLVHFGSVPAVFVCHDRQTASEDVRDEHQALRQLVARRRLSPAELDLIANRTMGGHGNYHAAVLMHETEVEPEEWVEAVLAVRQKPGMLGRLGYRLSNWFGGS
ncbi:MAG: FHA domain-containing protein [Planctomycetota bacterium]